MNSRSLHALLLLAYSLVCSADAQNRLGPSPSGDSSKAEINAPASVEAPPGLFLEQLDFARSVVVGTITALRPPPANSGLDSAGRALAVADVSQTLKGDAPKTATFGLFTNASFGRAPQTVGVSGIWLLDANGVNISDENGFFGLERLPEIERALDVLAHREWSAPANGLRACATVVSFKAPNSGGLKEGIMLALQNVASTNLLIPGSLDIQAAATPPVGKAERINLESVYQIGNRLFLAGFLEPGQTTYRGANTADTTVHCLDLAQLPPDATNAILAPGNYTVTFTIANHIPETQQPLAALLANFRQAGAAGVSKGGATEAPSAQAWTGSLSTPPVQLEITAAAPDIFALLPYGNLERINALLEAHPELVSNKTARFGFTPLHLVASLGRNKGWPPFTTNLVGVAKLLVAHQADVNARDDYGGTPLFSAIDSSHEEVVEFLLANGADPNIAESGGRTPLHEAAERDLTKSVRMLLASHAHVNARDNPGQTPLAIAARRGQTDIMGLLLANKAAVNAGDNAGETPLHFAARSGYTNAIELLLASHADINATNHQGQTPLDMATQSRHKAAAQLLLANHAKYDIIDVIAADDAGRIEGLVKQNQALVSSKDRSGKTLLHHAAAAGSLEAAKFLQANGAEVNAKDTNGATPLHAAAENGGKEIVQLLLANKAGINAWDNGGATPLLEAVKAGWTEAVTELLASNADPNIEANGESPLLAAVLSRKPEIAALLLARDADANTTNSDGLSPLHVAAARGDEAMVKMLLFKGADATARDKDGETPLFVTVANSTGAGTYAKVVTLLLDEQADANARVVGASPYIAFPDVSRRQQFPQAEISNHVSTRPGAPKHQATSFEGATALHVAAQNGRVELMKLLLAHNAEVNATNDAGDTPLHLALQAGASDEVVALLLANQADPNVKNNAGESPMEIAVKKGTPGTIDLLRRHGGVPPPANSPTRPRSGLQPATGSPVRLADAAPMIGGVAGPTQAINTPRL